MAPRNIRPAWLAGLIGWLAAVLLLVLSVGLAGEWAERAQIASLRERAAAQLELYTAILKSELGRYDHLPAVLQFNPAVLRLLREPEDLALVAEVNRYLEALNREAGPSDLYLLDRAGRTLAASNWNQPISFVGIDLSYRPYFQDALRHGSGQFYGIGTTSRTPGYYFARAVQAAGETLGVAVVKVNLDGIENPWARGSGRMLVIDEHGVVILAAEPGWRFRTLAPLPAATLEHFRNVRQYENVELRPLGLETERELGQGVRVVVLTGAADGTRERLLAQEQALPGSGWRVMVLSELDDLALIIRSAQAVTGLALGSLILLGLYLRQRRRAIGLKLAAQATLERANIDLEQKVAERTHDLRASNERLQREVQERERAEQVLRAAQDELVHAGKLAAVGQMAAGITHELNQPLAALRTLSDNALTLLRRQRLDDAQQNLAMIAGIVDRMAGITGQLKVFARKPQPVHAAVSVRHTLMRAIELLEPRLRTSEVRIVQALPEADLAVPGEGGRLEQVLVNLLANALDALDGRAGARIDVAAGQADGRVHITVADNGPGLGAEVLPRLFEPFFTTKAMGAGLGLGLTISEGIVRELGGVLRAANRPEGGAEFTIELPAFGTPGRTVHV
jgi:two-component system C4-dicarboxylate transport sensor histidine kinase DctB